MKFAINWVQHQLIVARDKIRDIVHKFQQKCITRQKSMPVLDGRDITSVI